MRERANPSPLFPKHCGKPGCHISARRRIRLSQR
jgi:hypothetical protein